MGLKFYEQNDRYVVGITLRNEQVKDDYNMAFTTKENMKKVITNRNNLANLLNISLEQFVCANQTHSTNLYKVMSDDRGCGAFSKETAIPIVDALYTYESNLVLCTFAADCVPVLFYNKSTGLIGVIHSGWKGTVNEITVSVLEYLKDVEQCNLSDMQVFIGPAISQEKFEVDDDVYDQYKQLQYVNKQIFYKPETNKYHIDNKAIIQQQCERVGIPLEQIKVDQMCTYLSDSGFSYRQNKTAKRHMGFIFRKKTR